MNGTIVEKILRVRVETVVLIIVSVVTIASNFTGDKVSSLERLTTVEKCCAEQTENLAVLSKSFQESQVKNAEMFGAINRNLDTLQKQSDKILSKVME